MENNKLKAVLVQQSVSLSMHNKSEAELLDLCGRAAGECYKAGESAEANKNRVLNCIKKGHTSILEHATISFTVKTDRGTSHALVRHRHCAFTQESTIYVNYGRFETLEFIALPAADVYKNNYALPDNYNADLEEYCQAVTDEYCRLLNKGIAPGIARDVLPNCLATTIHITTNLRELQSILKIRSAPADSVRMHNIIGLLEVELRKEYPVFMKAILGV
jgi:thymidylate synthase (FAD)|nr:MAG TPA: Thymidylate synthase complementing protein [Caudoviricetes sp.]